MMLRAMIGAAALTLAAAPSAAPATQPARAAVDWTTRVQKTPEGGYRMGNPNAARKLVEYGSITCSHCATFENTHGEAIRQQVRTGRVSFEYRPHPIFPSDPGLFLLLDCQPANRFFPTVHRLYADQASWVAKLQAQDAQLQQAMQRSFPEAIPLFVRASGTDALFRENGLNDRRIAACLADRAALQRMGDAAKRAQDLGVDGTPTFFLNGRKLELESFEQLLAMLRQP